MRGDHVSQLLPVIGAYSSYMFANLILSFCFLIVISVHSLHMTYLLHVLAYIHLNLLHGTDLLQTGFNEVRKNKPNILILRALNEYLKHQINCRTL